MKKIILILAVIVFAVAMLSGCSGSSDKVIEPTETNNEMSKEIGTSSEPQNEPSSSPEQTEVTAKQNDLIEPAQLISADEATQLIGGAVKEGEKTEQAVVGLKTLMYEATDENSFKFIQIALTQQAYMPDNGQTPQSIYDSIIAAFDGGEKIPGIGDAAAFATPGIHIMANGYYITIGAGNSDDAAVREILKQAGAMAVENLGKILD